MITPEDIDNWFTYHAPTPEQVERYNTLRDAAREFAHIIHDHTPPSREQTVALRKLRECIMYANAAIACNSE